MSDYLEVKRTVDRIAQENGRRPEEITLAAVSKGRTQEEIYQAYHMGCRDFGESRIQEALQKISLCPTDIRWHLIGTLQKNKVVKAVGTFCLIHSVDSFELAEKISQVSVSAGVNTSILLQVNTSGEITKHGLNGEDWEAKLGSLFELPGLLIDGLMTMAPFVEDEKIIGSCFAKLRMWRDRFAKMSGDPRRMRHLSMGMSHDYRIAIEEGATILRIGTAIFR